MKQPLVHYRRKKSKEKLRERDSNRYKKSGTINLCMTDTHNQFNKLMLIKKIPISGFIVWVRKLKQKGLSWLHNTKASAPAITKPE